eukprot:s1352_g2.t1
MAARGRALSAWLVLCAFLCVPSFLGPGHRAPRPVSSRITLNAGFEKDILFFFIFFQSDDEDRVDYMESPFGQAMGWLAKALSESPLNDAKISFAKMQAGEYDEEAAQKKLEGYIGGDKVVMFSFSKCPFCIKAKKELNDMGVPFTALDLDQMDQEDTPDGKELRAELAKKTKRTSMPNIFIAGEGIGGCNDGPGLMNLGFLLASTLADMFAKYGHQRSETISLYPKASRREGKVYLHKQDLKDGKELLAEGDMVFVHLYTDSHGLGAAEA